MSRISYDKRGESYMKIFYKHGPCKGMTLFRWGRFNIEIWFCPPRFQIEEHRHPSQDIELMFLYGDAFISRRHKDDPYGHYQMYGTVKFPYDTFKHFTVLAEHFHYFTVNEKWFVFLNISKWRKGHKPTSASVDFELSNNFDGQYWDGEKDTTTIKEGKVVLY